MRYFRNGSAANSSDFVSTEPFRVNSCCVSTSTASDFMVNRPFGRHDYQLLYVWEGQGKYLIDGRERMLGAGTVILYPPGVPQIYSYRAEYGCVVHWIHFSGTLAQPLLTRCGLMDNPVAQIGRLEEVNRLLTRIIQEMQRQEPQCEDQCAAYFIQLVTLIGRRMRQMADSSQYEREQRVRSVMEYLHLHYDEALSVDTCARQCALSRHHFIHIFRRYAGVSPYAYLTDIRLAEAARLLETTCLSVSDVARQTGYEDALYFSRLFKKKYGAPPTAYRRHAQQEENKP